MTLDAMREARRRLGLTQADLAKDIGVTRQTISQVESGDYNPTLHLCLKIAKRLDTDLNTLFWEGH